MINNVILANYPISYTEEQKEIREHDRADPAPTRSFCISYFLALPFVGRDLHEM